MIVPVGAAEKFIVLAFEIDMPSTVVPTRIFPNSVEFVVHVAEFAVISIVAPLTDDAHSFGSLY